MKKLSILISLVSLFCFIGIVLAAAPETVKYETKMGVVTFEHAKHQERLGAGKCNTCHHMAKADGSDARKCATCHEAKTSEKDGKQVPSLKDAYHKKTCKECHTSEKKGPTKCTECHIKNK